MGEHDESADGIVGISNDALGKLKADLAEGLKPPGLRISNRQPYPLEQVLKDLLAEAAKEMPEAPAIQCQLEFRVGGASSMAAGAVTATPYPGIFKLSSLVQDAQARRTMIEQYFHITDVQRVMIPKQLESTLVGATRKLWTPDS